MIHSAHNSINNTDNVQRKYITQHYRGRILECFLDEFGIILEFEDFDQLKWDCENTFFSSLQPSYGGFVVHWLTLHMKNLLPV